ncbi:class I SAM-dependent methyltransferase [Leptolyngbya sp. PCC 6406]|uniref:class I SAM-dependent methyltransferase n=1 Tax=Leptolyngbya sp. PCC 6406 TaxID=1173264 RepID=UPI0002ABA5E6|nr:class I SAM-dependent methyltransferase [Leptolyngbya sp. PCC 6406]
MGNVPGTKGYEKVADKFIEASQALNFSEVNRNFLKFILSVASFILDAGAGVGQNAAALARLGHSVVAIEPMSVFLDAARSTYRGIGVTWVEDSLPLLKKLGDRPKQFSFILVDGVWHHLEKDERVQAMARFATLLLDDGGTCAISLRHGPAGAGTHVFPTDGRKTAALAKQCGLEVVLLLENQPSIMKNKIRVTWTRIVARK